MHQSYLIFVPALGVYLILRGGLRAVWPWMAALALPVIAVYGAVFSATGLTLEEFPGWFRPEAPWMKLGMDSFFRMGTSLLHALSPSESVEPSLSLARLPAPVAIAVALAIGWRGAWRRFRHELSLCALLVAIFVPVVIRQGPTFQYFPPLVVAILLASALCLHAAERGILARRVLVVCTVLFSLASVALTLIPAHTRNDSLDRADFAGRAAGPGDHLLVLGAGNSLNDPVYFPYFVRRDAISWWRLECCSDPERELLDLLDAQIDRTILGGARVFLLDSVIARDSRLRTPLGGRFAIGGDALRDHLVQRYRLVDRDEYRARGYSERLLEITRLTCGPEPHFKSIDGQCVPSCGALLNGLSVSSSQGGCCARGCADGARLLGRTWDCEACCSGKDPICR